MTFFARISYLLIIYCCYLGGELLTKKLKLPIEFKYILPIISLVFLDYYMNLFSRWFFKIQVLNSTALDTDGEIYLLKTELRLSTDKNVTIFRIMEIKVKGYHITPCLTFDNKTYTPEGFERTLENNAPKYMKLECKFKNKPILKQRYCFVQTIKYSINDVVRTKKINIKRVNI
ncbi:MAG: hypothetical protein LBC31_09595 [Treponema sp.]|jgi:hypothetical protein|nr:hypothetical protein [Treponema sp.]